MGKKFHLAALELIDVLALLTLQWTGSRTGVAIAGRSPYFSGDDEICYLVESREQGEQCIRY
jgi:hypothetical protein